jgi:hypothetical protein
MKPSSISRCVRRWAGCRADGDLLGKLGIAQPPIRLQQLEHLAVNLSRSADMKNLPLMDILVEVLFNERLPIYLIVNSR